MQNLSQISKCIKGLRVIETAEETKGETAEENKPKPIPQPTSSSQLSLSIKSIGSALPNDLVIELMNNREEKPVSIKVTYSRNSMLVKKELKSIKDFVYLYLDLLYNNDTIYNVTIQLKG